MRKISFIILLGFLAFVSCNNSGSSENNTDPSSVYQCPMDCEHGKTYEKAGKCPVCGMDLEKVKKPAAAHDHPDSVKLGH